ncbi:MAG TPA: hypothetical protein VJH94_05070 [Candidatus Paceibacterota bacterium]
MNKREYIVVGFVAIVTLLGIASAYFVFSPRRSAENNNNVVVDSLTELRIQAELLFYDSWGYKELCSGGYINQEINSSLSQIISTILSAKGVSTQGDAGVQCSASDKEFSVSVSLLGGKHWCPTNPTFEGPSVKYCTNGSNRWFINNLGVAGLK